jgi:hypothetical protein
MCMLQNSLQSSDDKVRSLANKLQNSEMEMCRCMREKDEMEKVLRHRISAEEFEQLFHYSSDRVFLTAADSDDDSEERPVDTSDHYIDDFDDMSSCHGLHDVDESHVKSSRGRQQITNPVKENASVNRSGQLNISDLSSGVHSVASGTGSVTVGVSYDRGPQNGVSHISQHPLSTSRRSRGASVPLGAARTGTISFTPHQAPTRFRVSGVANSRQHSNARLNDALNRVSDNAE